MRIGVLCRTYSGFSVNGYREHIVKELKKNGVEFVHFTEKEDLPQHIDLYWDPGTGRPGPCNKFLDSRNPLVVTFHGVAHLALRLRECYGTKTNDMILGSARRIKTLYEWRRFRQRCAAIITVSSYAKQEIQQHLGLDKNKIYPIYHGVDLENFKPMDKANVKQSYFLHVSQYQPKKNVNRIIEAYRKLAQRNKPRLVMIVPGYPRETHHPKGVEIIRRSMNQKDLASFYKRALAFLFPSLHETFGMPILEAMACGCPVITSNVTACPEVAGGAALLVNPRLVDEIANAMKRLIENEHLRYELQEKGLARVKNLTWQRSAERHLEVFERVLQEVKKT